MPIRLTHLPSTNGYFLAGSVATRRFQTPVARYAACFAANSTRKWDFLIDGCVNRIGMVLTVSSWPNPPRCDCRFKQPPLQHNFVQPQPLFALQVPCLQPHPNVTSHRNLPKA
jgi:hypothetical protein